MKIEIENLRKSYGKFSVLKGIDLEIQGPTVFSLLGPNGSGKSTLLKCILGLVHPDLSGSIRFMGNGSIEPIEAFLRRAGYMPQVPFFPNASSVGEILNFLEDLTPEAPANKERLLEELSIGGFLKKRFSELSQGMKQKLNILQCFMFEKEIYLIDEPTAGLDPLNAHYLKEEIRMQRDRGATIVFTSHIMREVEELAEEVCMLLEGRIILQSSLKELLDANPGENLEKILLRTWRNHDNQETGIHTISV